MLRTSGRRIAAVVMLAVTCLLHGSAAIAAPPPRELNDVILPFWWENTGSMHSPRIDFTLALLPDGTALAAGGAYWNSGTEYFLSSSETYDIATGTWSLAGSMNTQRTRHSATVLLDGRVLVAGGTNGQGPRSSAELYDPVSRTWSLTGAMSQTREGHTATRLNDGRVLVVGGCQTLGCLSQAEIYNPATGLWQNAASLPAGARKYHTAVLLADGSVLVAGGYNPTTTPSATYYRSAYRYDPAGNAWSAAGNMTTYRSQHTAVLQRNGKVMVVGGYGVAPFGSASYPQYTEAYDPAANTWTALQTTGGADIIIDYGKKQALGVLDPFGSYYLIGGRDDTASGTVMYRSLNNDTDPWHAHGTLNNVRSGAAAVQLPNGAILVAGGKNEVAPNGMSSAEINTASNGSAELDTGSGILGSVYSSGTLMPNGDILFTGGADEVAQSAGMPCHKTAYLWLEEEAIDNLAAEMNWARCNHTTTLLPDGRVVVIGGSISSSGGSPAGAAEILANGVWTTISGPSGGFPGPETALLPDGEILIIDSTTRPHGYLFNPRDLTFRQTNGDYSGVYGSHTLTLMNNGKVLVLGSSSSDIIEVYDPETETFGVVPALSDRRQAHTATLLPNGKVLIAGGRLGSGPSQGMPLTDTYLFDPAALPGNPWTTLDTLHNARYNHSAVLLPDGRVVVLGGQTGITAAIKSVELYDPGDNTWAVIGDLLVDRTLHHTLLSGVGKLVTFGGMGDSFTARATVEKFVLTNVATWSFFTRPAVNPPTCVNCAGARQVDVTGSGFTAPPEGTSGGTAQAAANTPLVQIMRLDNQQVLWLNPASTSSDTHFLSDPIPDFPIGPVMVYVYTKGSAQGRVLLIDGNGYRINLPAILR